VKIMDEEMGEILVVRNESSTRIEVHIRGARPDEYRLVRLTRHEARRLAALVLYQAERLGMVRLLPEADINEVGLKRA